MRDKVELCDAILDEELAAAGFKQNRGKQEANIHVPTTRRRTAALCLREGGSKTEENTRYVGPHLNEKQSFSAELVRRIAAMKQSFFMLGRFWSKARAPDRWKRCLLLCRVVNTAISAVEACCPSPQQPTSKIKRGYCGLVSEGNAGYSELGRKRRG